MAIGIYEKVAKVATVSAVVFGVSLGLCGATALLSGVLHDKVQVLIPFGILELLGMVVGVIGLLAAGFAVLIVFVRTQFAKDKEKK